MAKIKHHKKSNGQEIDKGKLWPQRNKWDYCSLEKIWIYFWDVKTFCFFVGLFIIK